MLTTTQTNVLKLDSKPKEGRSCEDNSVKKLKISYSRDKNLTNFQRLILLKNELQMHLKQYQLYKNILQLLKSYYYSFVINNAKIIF